VLPPSIPAVELMLYKGAPRFLCRYMQKLLVSFAAKCIVRQGVQVLASSPQQKEQQSSTQPDAEIEDKLSFRSFKGGSAFHY
jgi:hypothetical protein